MLANGNDFLTLKELSTHYSTNLECLAKLDEAAQQIAEEARKTASLAQLKEQIQRVREAIAKLDEVIR